MTARRPPFLEFFDGDVTDRRGGIVRERLQPRLPPTHLICGDCDEELEADEAGQG
jgi:hypothetical protein